MEVHFKRERRGENGEMVEDKQRHYFKEYQPHVFTKANFKETFNQKFNEFVDQIKGEIENWSERGSGSEVDEITIAFVNVARFQPLKGGTYIQLPRKLGNKKAIINV